MYRFSFCIGSLLLLVAAYAEAKAPYPPAESPGSLVIVGGGAIPDDIRKEFVRLAGGNDARIVVIPTAGEAADNPAKVVKSLERWKAMNVKSVTALHTRDAKQANDPAFVKPLTQATAVWFDGGLQKRLAEAYRGTQVEKELHQLLARDGVIGGSSAGAAIMSDLMIESGTATAITSPGLSFLPGIIIDQHFTQRRRLGRLRDALAKYPGYAGIGIDESTALVVRGRIIRVLGEGTATVCWSKSAAKPIREEVLHAGDLLDSFQVRRAAANRARSSPFPAKVLNPPIVAHGSLVVVGGGGAGPEIWKRFITLAGGPKALILVVPTASEQRTPILPIEVQLLRRYGAENVKVLHTRDRAKADTEDFSKELLQAGGVWFGGGRQWRFVDAYEDTLTLKRFHDVLKRGGVIGGSSAGASIQSEFMPRGHPLGNFVMAAEGYEKGFGFLPGCAVDQHFFARKRTADMTALMKRYPQFLGIGIDEGTAIVVQGSRAEVIGKSKVGFYDYRTKVPEGEIDYTEVKTGGAYDLVKREPVK